MKTYQVHSVKLHRPDLEFILQRIDKSCIDRLENVASSSFIRVPYTEAIALLEDAIAKKKVKFENPVRGQAAPAFICGIYTCVYDAFA